MKNKFLLLAVLFGLYLIPQQSKAQLYDKGTITINPGISFGAIGFGGYNYGGATGFLPVSASLEYSINDKFAIGPYAGFYSRKYSNAYRWTAIAFGARGTFHATPFINETLDANIDEDKFDIYASALLGIETFRDSYDDGFLGNRFNNNYTNPRFGIVIGARYMFMPNVGAFLELGRGALGYSTLGLTFKF